jgi:hypothetical protein
VPELVDVEGFRRVLAEQATGRRVVDVRDSGVLRGTSAGALRSALIGRRFAQPWRHGKWLIAPTDGPAVAMHFGMTGALVADSSAQINRDVIRIHAGKVGLDQVVIIGLLDVHRWTPGVDADPRHVTERAGQCPAHLVEQIIKAGEPAKRIPPARRIAAPSDRAVSS